MTGDFFFSHFQHIIFLLLLQYICIFLCARPKHTCSLSHKSIWRSPDAAEVAGSEQWWPHISPGWPGWLWCVTGCLEVQADLCPCGMNTITSRGCWGLLCAAWALAPCPRQERKWETKGDSCSCQSHPWAPSWFSEPFTSRARSLFLAQG